MIRIDAYLLPKGDASMAKSLGSVEIANVGGTRERGEYAVRIMKGGARRALWRLGKVVGFPRLSLGVWDLLLRALADIVAAEKDGARRAIEVPADWQKPISDASIEAAEAERLHDGREEIAEAIREWMALPEDQRRAVLQVLEGRIDQRDVANRSKRAAAAMLKVWCRPGHSA